MQTLILDTVAWDLVVDASGNIGVASDPYSLAQDAASNIRLFAGELYYDTSLGIPYFAEVLGKTPPLSLLRSLFVSAAKEVPGVKSAKCFFTSWDGRVLSGQVQIVDASGTISTAGF